MLGSPHAYTHSSSYPISATHPRGRVMLDVGGHIVRIENEVSRLSSDNIDVGPQGVRPSLDLRTGDWADTGWPGVGSRMQASAVRQSGPLGTCDTRRKLSSDETVDMSSRAPRSDSGFKCSMGLARTQARLSTVLVSAS